MKLDLGSRAWWARGCNWTAPAGGGEKKSWIERQRDPADRRAHIVRMTAAGMAGLEKVRPAARAATQELLAPLNEDEQAQLRALLARLVP